MSFHTSVIIPVPRLRAVAAGLHNEGRPRAITDTASARYIHSREGSIAAVARYFGVSWGAAYTAVHGCLSPAEERRRIRIRNAVRVAQDAGGISRTCYDQRVRAWARG